MKKKNQAQDLIAGFIKHNRLSPDKAELFVNTFFNVLENALVTDKYVKIKGLGTFKLVSVSDRESVDVNTGEHIQISGHSRVSFSVDTNLKEVVNRPFAHFEPIDLEDETTAAELEGVDEQMRQLFPSENNYPEENSTDSETEETENEEDRGEPSAPTSENTETNEEADSTAEKEDKASEIIPISASEEEPELPTDADGGKSVVSNREEQPTPLNAESGNEKKQSERTEKVALEDEDADDVTTATESAPLSETSEAEQNHPSATPIPEDTSTETPDENETPSAAEEENEVKVSEPLTINQPTEDSEQTPSHMKYTYTEVTPPNKHNWWKITALTLLAVILLAASYFAGYYRLLCPSCHMLDNATIQQMPEKSASAQNAVQPTPVTDTLARSQKTTVPPATTQAEQKKEQTDYATQRQKPQAAAEQSKKSDEKTGATSAESKKATPDIIRHTVKRGENLTRIVRRYYGSDAYVGKVIRHNHLSDADNVIVGTVLELPMN